MPNKIDRIATAGVDRREDGQVLTDLVSDLEAGFAARHRSGRLVDELTAKQITAARTDAQKLRRRSCLDDLALIENDNPIGAQDRGQTMCDDQDRALAGQTLDRLLDH